MDNLFTKTIKSALLVGTLDILTVFIYHFIETGQGPADVLAYISSAVFGKDAFSGAKKIIAFGLIFHYMVTYTFTLLFFLVFPNLIAIFKNKFLVAVLYSPFMWAVVLFLVLPLSAAAQQTVTFSGAIISIAINIICIAIPLSFMATQFYSKRL